MNVWPPQMAKQCQRSSLHLLFNALVINELTYARPAYAGQLTADDLLYQESLSLLKPLPTVLIGFVRVNIYTCFPSFNIRSLKTLISIVVYLNIITSDSHLMFFFSSVHIALFMLCVLYFVYFIDIQLVTECDCHTE